MARQHTVTRCIIRKWADENDQVLVWDWRTERTFKQNTKLAGSFPDYVPEASGPVAEKLWNTEFERGISEIIDSFDDWQTTISDQIADALRDLMALHYVRCGWIKATWVESLARGLDTSTRRLAQTSAIDIGQGLVLPTSPSAVAAALSRMETEFAAQDGLAFLSALVSQLESVRSALGAYEVQVLTALPDAGEFVLGDHPAVTWSPDSGRCGMPNGMRLGETYELLMPLSPRHAVQLGPERARVDVDQRVVDALVSKQMAGSVDHVYLRPTGDVDRLERIHNAIKDATIDRISAE